MKRVRAALALAAMLLGAAGYAGTAAAHGYHHGPRVSFGFAFGPAYWYPPYPYYYYPPPYYYPPVVTTAPAPTTYIERGDVQQPAADPRKDWWYYCPESKTYYPYVKQCAGGWQKVEPRPSSGQNAER